MAKRRRYIIPGAYGGLYVPYVEKEKGITLKPKEVIILTILLVIAVWILRLIF